MLRSLVVGSLVLGLAGPGAVGADLVAVSGVVLDAGGRPLPFVSVGLYEKMRGGSLVDPTTRTIADGRGRFAFGGVRPGDYEIAPVRDIAIVAGVTRPEQLAEADRPGLEAGGGALLVRPLPATFVRREITLDRDRDRAGFEVALRAIPHVTWDARFVDPAGQPTAAGVGYEAHGWVDKAYWSAKLDPVPGRFDAVRVLVPLGLKAASVRTQGDDVWWTWGPDVPRQAGDGAALDLARGDLPSILAERVRGSTLEVRVGFEGGKTAPGRTSVVVTFPVHRGGIAAEVSADPEEVRPGVYRLARGLLPGRPVALRVTADGHRGVVTREFRFPSGDQRGTIDLTLKPGERDLDAMFRDPEGVRLLDAEGRAIPGSDPLADPVRSIACRAVDAATGRPVGGAEVAFGAEQQVDDAGRPNHAWLEQGKARTDADGRFVVTLPEAYLPDPAPRRAVHARVTIKHPGYVTYWDTADAREIASRGVSADFPGFVLVRLLPARFLTGRLLDPDGRPLAGVTIHKHYDINSYPRDAEFPETDAEGRFRALVPVGVALKLEFRAGQAARNYFEVAADRSDLGDVRLARGIRVKGRVVDAEGAPVRGVLIATPSVPVQHDQPNFVEFTDQDGRFETDELAPGRYRVEVGAIHLTDAGERSPTPVRDAPGVYLATPLDLKPGGGPFAELTLRPVESIRLVATLEPDLSGAGDRGHRPTRPWFGVRGTIGGIPWASRYTVDEAEDDDHSSHVDVPRGLADAVFVPTGWVGFLRLEPGDPELFGPAIGIGPVDAVRPPIAVRVPRAATVEVRLPGAARLAARYARQGAMEARGVRFDSPEPFPNPARDGDLVRVDVLPGEDIDLEAAAPGLQPASARVRLEPGETRRIALDPR